MLPNKLFFQPQLKIKQSRIRTSFAENITASLALPQRLFFPKNKMKNANASYDSQKLQNQSSYCHRTMFELQKKTFAAKDFATLDYLTLQKVELAAESIQEHAARRVDLFFYLLLAFYKTQLVIKKGKTLEQHGFGKKVLDTVGCHSSLFPNILIQRAFNVWQSDPNFDETQFGKSLHMTVELPSIVNLFDNQLEGSGMMSHYVHTCLNTINQTANETLDPKDAMNIFFITLDQFFNDYKETILHKRVNKFHHALTKVWEYQRTGTFLAANGLKVKEEYLHLMLRIKPEEILDDTLLPLHYLRIQTEIWGNKADKKISHRGVLARKVR